MSTYNIASLVPARVLLKAIKIFSCNYVVPYVNEFIVTLVYVFVFQMTTPIVFGAPTQVMRRI